MTGPLEREADIPGAPTTASRSSGPGSGTPTPSFVGSQHEGDPGSLPDDDRISLADARRRFRDAEREDLAREPGGAFERFDA